MNFVRKSVLVLTTALFIALLFATALDMGVIRVISQPSNIKQILADSGAYNSAVNSVLAQSGKISTSDGSVSLTDPTIRAAANSTFTPQFVRSNTETVIDSIYAWLNGKTTSPNFNIDLSGGKSQFASAAAQAVQTRVAGLPVCTPANELSSFDALSSSCLPRGVTPSAVADEVQADIVSGTGFLDQPVINANSLKSTRSNQSVFADQLKSAPQQYQRVKKTPVIFAILTLLAAAAIIFLSSSRRKGLRRVGIVLLIVGLLMLVFAWGLNECVAKVTPKIKVDNSVVQTDLRNLITDISQKIDQNYWIFGAVYTLLGVLAIAAERFWKDGNKNTKKVNDDLEGEGKTAEDRIDLRESDQPIALSDTDSASKPSKPAAKKKIEIK